MVGLLLALISSFLFALSNVYIRQGVFRSGESFSPIPISGLCGVVIFGVPLFISGEFRELTSFSSLALISIAGAGIVHFVFGRVLAYAGVRLIGANRATTVLNSNILIAALSGIILFNEPLTAFLVLGFVFITSGVLIICSSIYSSAKGGSSAAVSPMKGIFVSLGGAFCWGISPMLIKIGFTEGVSTLSSIFVSYVAASIVVAFLMFHRGNVEKMRRLDRSSLLSIVKGSVAVAIAQLFRYFAFEYSPISLVAPVAGTSPLFVLPLSFMINRSIEAFGIRIIAGTIATVIGVFLIFWVV
ncbi:DMT family transporter [bacterium]|nr:DMT family transporter [bacterium]